MSERDYDDSEESCNAYYKRKQSVKHNQVAPEAEVLHDKDRDAEVAASKWEGAPRKDRWGKSSSLWDDEPWKDKDQGRGS
jgi:hypothetical protein